MLVTLEETKEYLRIDGDYDDGLIEGFITTAQELCLTILRKSELELAGGNPQLKTAVFYAVAYLYEHREEADHKNLVLTLRALLSGLRKDVF